MKTLVLSFVFLVTAATGQQGFATSEAPKTPEEYLAVGISKYNKYVGAKALQDFDRAIALRPDWAQAYLERARARLRAIPVPSDLGPFEKEPDPPLDAESLRRGSLEDVDRAIALNPHLAEAYQFRGDYRAGRLLGAPHANEFAAAVADYTRAIEEKPNFPEVYFARYSARNMAHQEGGEADLDQAITLQPEYADALKQRAYIRRSGGDLKGAIDDIDHALAAVNGRTSRPPNAKDNVFFEGTDGPQLLSLRSALKENIDDLDGALTDINEAIARQPTNEYNWAVRGAIKQERGDLIGAITDYATYKELNGDFPGIRPRAVSRKDGKDTPILPPPNAVHLQLHAAQLRLGKGNPVMELRAIAVEWREDFLKNVALYLSGGGVSEENLLKLAEQGEAEAVKRQQCIAWYYIGIRRLVTHQPEEAKYFFEQCLGTHEKRMTVYRLARAELAGLTAASANAATKPLSKFP